MRRDIPVAGVQADAVWGSDAIAAMLRALDIPYVCVNPGASFRGLHDSIVNYLGNERPQMLLCLHEEHAVAIGHGYAQVTGKPLLAIVHSNVGLMHASMAMFNAWCDRMPVIVLGATGPVDAAKRRPWIDWIHTMRDQSSLVRDFVKWDDQPASIAAAFESILRAQQIAQTAPKGPVYVCFDAALQEDKLAAMPRLPDLARYRPAPPLHAAPILIQECAEWLTRAQRPLILMGRATREMRHWESRVELAERLNARVLTDLKVGAAFPTDHPLHAAPPGIFLSPQSSAALKQADVVLSLDWVDLAGSLKQAWGTQAVAQKIIQVSPDAIVHNASSMDYQALPPADMNLLCEPESVVADLLHHIPARGVASAAKPPPLPSFDANAPLSIASVAAALKVAVGESDVTLVHLPLGWSGDLWHFRHPLDFLGSDGGGGIGAGPGLTVGAAIALKGGPRLPIAILGDGDYLMGVSALWTAAAAGVPFLIIVCNNRSFFNDEVHQERVARDRGRPVENKWIGQRIDNPAPDLAMLARAQGVEGIGPITSAHALPAALADAISRLRLGRAVVVDVHVMPGYTPSMAAGMTRK
jgi:thiamine pyrophosphate-dependent acetolactate synthase large subunit-like protein